MKGYTSKHESGRTLGQFPKLAQCPAWLSKASYRMGRCFVRQSIDARTFDLRTLFFLNWRNVPYNPSNFLSMWIEFLCWQPRPAIPPKWTKFPKRLLKAPRNGQASTWPFCRWRTNTHRSNGHKCERYGADVQEIQKPQGQECLPCKRVASDEVPSTIKSNAPDQTPVGHTDHPSAGIRYPNLDNWPNCPSRCKYHVREMELPLTRSTPDQLGPIGPSCPPFCTLISPSS